MQLIQGASYAQLSVYFPFATLILKIAFPAQCMVVSPRSQSEKTVHYLRPHELLLRLDTLFAKTMRRAARCLRAQGKGGKTEKLFARTMAEGSALSSRAGNGRNGGETVREDDGRGLCVVFARSIEAKHWRSCSRRRCGGQFVVFARRKWQEWRESCSRGRWRGLCVVSACRCGLESSLRSE